MRAYLTSTRDRGDPEYFDSRNLKSLHEEIESVDPHRDGRGDFARSRSESHTIHGSVLWEIFGEVHGGFVDHAHVFGGDDRFELLG